MSNEKEKFKIELAKEAGSKAAARVAGVSAVNDVSGDTVLNSDVFVADIYIDVCYGYSIPEVSWNVQNEFISAVREATGMEVNKADIHIMGVGF